MKNIYILFVLLLIAGCSDDFLELTPKDTLNGETFYTTENEFNEALIGIYAKLQGQVNIYFEMSEWRSDYLDLGAPTSGTQDRFNINKFVDTPSNGIIEGAWANFYNGILRSNLIINRITGAGFEETTKSQIEAEARFIRALTYFNIVRLWGDAPIILTEISAEQGLEIGRSPVSEVYVEIENDLNYAIQNLPSSKDLGRATSNAAKALLGKVLLTQGKYGDAETVLRELIGGVYSLQPNLADVFDPNNKGNNEIIFSIRFNKDVLDEGHGYWFSVGDLSTVNLTDKLVNAFSVGDLRANMIAYQPTNDNSFIPAKFFDAKVDNKVGNDFIVLRYADVLLMLAEAINEQAYSATGDAYTFLNEVRNRAGLTTPLTATDLPNQEAFRATVLNERFLEFPLEGQRWFDLIRTGAANDEILSAIGVNVSNDRFIYPIPNAEIEKINNDQLYYQNTGY